MAGAVEDVGEGKAEVGVCVSDRVSVTWSPCDASYTQPSSSSSIAPRNAVHPTAVHSQVKLIMGQTDARAC